MLTWHIPGYLPVNLYSELWHIQNENHIDYVIDGFICKQSINILATLAINTPCSILNKMLHLRYLAGFWICAWWYASTSEYARVGDILVFSICQGCTRFWIKRFMIDVWQYSEYAFSSEYAWVLNMLGLHMVLKWIPHHRYFTGPWLWQGYKGFCRKRPTNLIWQGSEHSSGCEYTSALNIQGS